MIVRREGPGEFPAIYELIADAFRTAEISDGDEQDWALQLRESENYIPELSLVAEQDGKLIGQIMLTKTLLVTEDDIRHEMLLLSPVSVKLEQRNRGVGEALVREALSIAGQMGYVAVFLAGERDYYGRFGFRPAAEHGINNLKGIPDEHALVLELQDGALENLKGTVDIT